MSVNLNDLCAVCGRAASLWCSSCQNIWYCSFEHRSADWPRHSSQCHSAPAYRPSRAHTIAALPEPEYISGNAILFAANEDRPRIITDQRSSPHHLSHGVGPLPFPSPEPYVEGRVGPPPFSQPHAEGRVYSLPFPQPYAEGQHGRLPFPHPSPFHEDFPYSSGHRPLSAGDSSTTPTLDIDTKVDRDEPTSSVPLYAYANTPSTHHEVHLFPSSVSTTISPPWAPWEQIDARQTVQSPPLRIVVPGQASIPPMQFDGAEASYYAMFHSPFAALPEERRDARHSEAPSTSVPRILPRKNDTPPAEQPSFLDGLSAICEEPVQDNEPASPDYDVDVDSASGAEGVENSGERNISASGGTGGGGGSGGIVGGNGGTGMGPMFGGTSFGAGATVIIYRQPRARRARLHPPRSATAPAMSATVSDHGS
ncbi:hypothetical protein K438DRAFT_281610 [Mycena galopus ATCC 62051]|nr:hypothetical protein K438DRAFT_281610 [Mycena galopus ATCC 62051]